MKLLPVVLICTILSICHGYRILGVFPFNGKSHFMMFEQLMKILARRGHQVDVISTFPLTKPYPNYNDLIVLPAGRQFMNNMTYDEIKTLFAGSPTHVVATLAGNDICEFLNNSQVQQLIRNPPNDPPYDAVIMEVWIIIKYRVRKVLVQRYHFIRGNNEIPILRKWIASSVVHFCGYFKIVAD